MRVNLDCAVVLVLPLAMMFRAEVSQVGPGTRFAFDLEGCLAQPLLARRSSGSTWRVEQGSVLAFWHLKAARSGARFVGGYSAFGFKHDRFEQV